MHELLNATETYTENLFDKYSYFFDSHLINKLKYRLHLDLAFILRKNFSSDHVFSNALDIGCGTGLCGSILKPMTHHLVGVDLSKNMLEQCEEKNFYNELYKGSFDDFSKVHSKTKYELIVCLDTLAYIKKPSEFLKNIHHSQSKHGYFIGSIEPSSKEKLAVSNYGRFLHSWDQMCTDLKSAGYSLIDSFQTHFRFENKKPQTSIIFIAKNNYSSTKEA